MYYRVSFKIYGSGGRWNSLVLLILAIYSLTCPLIFSYMLSIDNKGIEWMCLHVVNRQWDTGTEVGL